MRYLLDTGILLTLVNREAAMHDQVRQTVRLLKTQGARRSYHVPEHQ